MPKEKVHPNPGSLSGASPPWFQPAPDCKGHVVAPSSSLIPDHPGMASLLSGALTIFALHSQNSTQSLSAETAFPLTSTTQFTRDYMGCTLVQLGWSLCDLPQAPDLCSLLGPTFSFFPGCHVGSGHCSGTSSQSLLQPCSASARKLPFAQSLR